MELAGLFLRCGQAHWPVKASAPRILVLRGSHRHGASSCKVMAEKQVFPVGLACGMWGLSCFCTPRRFASTLGKLVLSVSHRSCKDTVTSQSVPARREGSWNGGASGS